MYRACCAVLSLLFFSHVVCAMGRTIERTIVMNHLSEGYEQTCDGIDSLCMACESYCVNLAPTAEQILYAKKEACKIIEAIHPILYETVYSPVNIAMHSFFLSDRISDRIVERIENPRRPFYGSIRVER